MESNPDDLTVGFPRDCIECDGPNCSAKAPDKRCSRCRAVYYCSANCQKRDWKGHKPYCLPVEDMRKKAQAKPKVLDPSELLQQGDSVSVNPDQECPICLAAPIEQPVTLKSCQHSFCTKCMIEWQSQSERLQRQNSQNTAALSCPLCRSDTENVEQGLMERASLLAGEANVRDLTPEGRTALRQEALACVDRVLASENTFLPAYFTKAEILLSLGDGAAAVEAIKMLREENEKRKEHPMAKLMKQVDEAEGRGDHVELQRLQEAVAELFEETKGDVPKTLKPGQLFHVHMLESKLYQFDKKWSEALDCLINALRCIDGPESQSAVEQRKLWMGLAECAYKGGKYDMALSASEAALDMNRAFDQVHKHRALAFKALGKMDEAIDTMNRAVLYETPWNIENIRKNIALYNELVAERDATE